MLGVVGSFGVVLVAMLSMVALDYDRGAAARVPRARLGGVDYDARLIARSSTRAEKTTPAALGRGSFILCTFGGGNRNGFDCRRTGRKADIVSNKI